MPILEKFWPEGSQRQFREFLYNGNLIFTSKSCFPVIQSEKLTQNGFFISKNKSR